MLQAQPYQHTIAVDWAYFRTVGNKFGSLAITLQIIFRDLARVGDNNIRTESRQPLRNQIPGSRQLVPLLPLPLQAVHVKRDRRPKQPRPESKDGIRSVAIQRNIRAMKQQMQRGKKAVNDGIEILVTPSGQVNQRDAAIT